MKRCTTCGGELIAMDGKQRICAFCGNVYGNNGADTNPIKLAEGGSLDAGANVFEKNRCCMLEIGSFDGKYYRSGSGFVISSDGYAITNAHVVMDEFGETFQTVVVSADGFYTKAEVIKLGCGEKVDLALLKLEKNKGFRSAKIADFSKVRNGEKVFVIGNSLGQGTCITSGVVSDRRRAVCGKEFLMTDCAINGGNSGGPVFNVNGEVIAVVVGGVRGAEGMNYGIPSDDVFNFIRNSGQHISLV